MKALTLWQPWASLVAYGVKTIETRSWSTSYRGRLAIHAAKRDTDNTMFDHQEPWAALEQHIGGDAPPHGAVVAVCTLVDVVPMQAERGLHGRDGQGPIIAISHSGEYVTGLTWRNTVSPGRYIDKVWTEGEIAANRPFGDFAPGRFAWLLRDIQRLDPIPARGRQRLWKWAGSKENEQGELEQVR